ncbi:hypothetical protein L6475_04655 [Prevotella sp. E9-3]|uniref:hypothetical protein n=1 Tax=Prevotella sp. E9-3 TaxID=2913621 RepID=UPI001EDC2BC7|nr:hypothetical protein [Prevotella sp. E9-3]UKK49255.1 hypothetical protein L6475_04655 [Prevotella sp. E9-3]
MKILVLIFLLLVCVKGYSAEPAEQQLLLDEFTVKGVNWCETRLDNVHYIMTSGEPLSVQVYLEGRKINLRLKNENKKEVTYYLRCNGFVHTYNEAVGKEPVNEEYTYSGTLATDQETVYTIGHRSMITVIGHGGVPGSFKDLATSYRDMLYAGFDVSICTGSPAESLRMLKEAREKGIRLVVGGGSLNDYKTLADSAQKNKNTVYGYYIGDEPFLKKNDRYRGHATLDDLLPRAKAIRSIDPLADFRICLNPIYGPETVNSDGTYNNQRYADYIDSCITRLKLTNIAFDNYSIIWSKGDEVLRRQWFDNLEIVSSQSQKHGIPFCGYVLSAQHLSYTLPTLGTLRLQVYANLVYGAKSIAYYTYWHRWLPGEGSYVAPVDSFGQRRAGLYDAINRVNEEMARISPLFAEGTVKKVYHINGAPSNVLIKQLTPDNLPDNIESLTIEDGKRAIASVIEKDKASYLALVNKDFRNPVTLHIRGNKHLRHVSKLDLKYEKVTTGHYTIEAGDIILFRFK